MYQANRAYVCSCSVHSIVCCVHCYAVRLIIAFVDVNKTYLIVSYLTTSGFVSVDVTAFRSSTSISKPNFVKISQMAAEIKLLPVSKYKRPPYWNSTPDFDLDQFAVNCMLFRHASLQRRFFQKYADLSSLKYARKICGKYAKYAAIACSQ